jgi:hypothetical protein
LDLVAVCARAISEEEYAAVYGETSAEDFELTPSEPIMLKDPGFAAQTVVLEGWGKVGSSPEIRRRVSLTLGPDFVDMLVDMSTLHHTDGKCLVLAFFFADADAAWRAGCQLGSTPGVRQGLAESLQEKAREERLREEARGAEPRVAGDVPMPSPVEAVEVPAEQVESREDVSVSNEPPSQDASGAGPSSGPPGDDPSAAQVA